MRLYFILIACGKYVQVNFSLFIFFIHAVEKDGRKLIMKKLENDKLLFIRTLKKCLLNFR